MSTIFMSSNNSKTSHTHRLRLKISEKIDLQGGDNCVALSKHSIFYKRKNRKKCTETINLKYQE